MTILTLPNYRSAIARDHKKSLVMRYALSLPIVRNRFLKLLTKTDKDIAHKLKVRSLKYCIFEFITLVFFIIAVREYYLSAILILIMCSLSVMVLIVAYELLIIQDKHERGKEKESPLEKLTWALAVLGVLFAFFNGFPLIHIIIMPIFMAFCILFLKYMYFIFFRKQIVSQIFINIIIISGFYLDIENIAVFFILSAILSILIYVLLWIATSAKYNASLVGMVLSLNLCIIFPYQTQVFNWFI